MRLILKTEKREMTFGHEVIGLNFSLMITYAKLRFFWPPKVRFQGEMKKNGMAADGIRKI